LLEEAAKKEREGDREERERKREREKERKIERIIRATITMATTAASSKPRHRETVTVQSATPSLPLGSQPHFSRQQLVLSKSNVHVELTPGEITVTDCINRVRTPKAGAIVVFIGTTRGFVQPAQAPPGSPTVPVLRLTYTSYAPLALQTLLLIAQTAVIRYSLTGISMTHRLGEVPVGEESVVVVVSAPHRAEAWKAAEEALEECKRRAEIWKKEIVDVGEGEQAFWRANRDGAGRSEEGQEQEG